MSHNHRSPPRAREVPFLIGNVSPSVPRHRRIAVIEHVVMANHVGLLHERGQAGRR